MARVLIIDDDPAICRMTSEMVKKIGHEAETAMTLQGGVEEVDKILMMSSCWMCNSRTESGWRPFPDFGDQVLRRK